MSGGIPALRAIARWAWRLFRREWRQQVLVIVLITVTVALALAGSSAGYKTARPLTSEFGTADHRLVTELAETTDRQALDTYFVALEERFGPIDVISKRRVPIPGSTEALELRSQDPNGPYGAPMLELSEGRYPMDAGEVALTDHVAETFRLTVGDTLELHGEQWAVAGLVQNPTHFDDEFALVPPSPGTPVDTLTVLVKGSEEQVRTFPADLDPGPGYFESRDSLPSEEAGLDALAAATVLLLLVCLVGAASFVVVAQRRLRQLGMLATVGATPRHLRLVVLANGATVGAVAAVLGTALGLAAWVAVEPRLERAAGHRIDRFDIPWLLVAVSMVLAVTAATSAAWWPARTMARVPITRALSGRPPKPRAARRSLFMAVPLIGIGVASLAAGTDMAEEGANALLLVVGVVAIPVGIALLSPAAIQLLSPLATRLPIAGRLALRDLIRYRARSGATLAAISLGLGIAVTVVVVAAAAEYATDEGNLSDRQLLFWIDEANDAGVPVDVPEQTPAELDAFESTIDQVAEGLDDAAVIHLGVAVDPAAKEPRGGEVLQPPVALGTEISETTLRDSGPIYVATPEVVRHAGLDPTSIGPDSEVLTAKTGTAAFFYIDTSEKNTPIQNVEKIDVSSYSSAPQSFITPEAISLHGWESAPAAWLVESGKPLTADQLSEAREAAAAAGMTVEVRRGQDGLSYVRKGATAAGVLLGLGILAMTVGLIRSEAASDLRTLAATGASSRVRRTITGMTAGALALLGAILGSAGAYTALTAIFSSDIDQLLPLPVPELLIIVLGLPLLAAAAGWLLAGRQPPAVARTPIE